MVSVVDKYKDTEMYKNIFKILSKNSYSWKSLESKHLYSQILSTCNTLTCTNVLYKIFQKLHVFHHIIVYIFQSTVSDILYIF